MPTTGLIEEAIKAQERIIQNKNLPEKIESLLYSLDGIKIAGITVDQRDDHTCLSADCDFSDKGVPLSIKYSGGDYGCGCMSLKVEYNKELVLEMEGATRTQPKIICYSPGDWEDLLDSRELVSRFQEFEIEKAGQKKRERSVAEKDRRNTPADESLLDRARSLGIDLNNLLVS